MLWYVLELPRHGQPVASIDMSSSVCRFCLSCWESWSADAHSRCSEAIEILYSANTFDINTNWTLRWLSQKILPQHFHAIRSPRLRWFLPGVPATDIKTEADDFWAFDNEREWRTTWQCLASMQGLKYLHVELYTYSRMIDWRVELSKNDSAVFEHLKAVTRPEHFDLILPSWADFDPSALRDLPCRLRIAVEA